MRWASENCAELRRIAPNCAELRELRVAAVTFLSMSGASAFAFSIAASEQTKIAGCEYSVVLSFSCGPCAQRSTRL